MALLQRIQPRCVLCQQTATLQDLRLCPACHQDLPRFEQACQLCSLPLAEANQHLCGQCQQDPPPWDSMLAAMPYTHEAAFLVQQLKFGHQAIMARVLAMQLLGRLQALRQASPASSLSLLPDALLPVPLHPRRLRTRHYNQAELIARPLGKALALPILTRAVYRSRYTSPQSQLDRSQRQHNLSRAFTLRRPIPYQRIAIVDDVVTTGSTAAELGRLLKAHGVKHVQIWCAVRTLDKGTSGK